MNTALLRTDRTPNRFRLTRGGVFGAAVVVAAAAVVTGVTVLTGEMDDPGEIAWFIFLFLIMVFGLPTALLTVGIRRLRPDWLATGSWALVPVTAVGGASTGVLISLWSYSSGVAGPSPWWGVGVGAVAGFAGCLGVRHLNARRPRVAAGPTD